MIKFFSNNGQDFVYQTKMKSRKLKIQRLFEFLKEEKL